MLGVRREEARQIHSPAWVDMGRETGSRAGEGSCYAVGGYDGQMLKWVRNVLAACARLGKGVAGVEHAGLESACGGLHAGV